MRRAHKALIIGIVAIIFVSCLSNREDLQEQLTPPASESMPTLSPTASLPTNTPSPTPWVNIQGYPLMLDSKSHLMVRIPASTFTMGINSSQAQVLCDLAKGYFECDPQELQNDAHHSHAFLQNQRK